MRRPSAVLPVLSALFVIAHPGGAQVAASPVQAERLVYNVRWSFPSLGTVVIALHTSGSESDRSAIATMAIRSNPSIPFLDIDVVHETTFCPEGLRIDRERMVNYGRSRTQYLFSALERCILMLDSVDGQEYRRLTVPAPDQCYDVNTLLLFARRQAQGRVSVSLPTAIDYAVSPTEIQLTGEVEPVEVPAFPVEVRCRHFTGMARWMGSSSAGMSGAFEGWVSDVEAAVPVRARVKIGIGSIALELVGFERPGWDTAALFQPDAPLVDFRREQP